MDSKKAQIVKNPVADFALEITFFLSDVFVQMKRQVVSLAKVGAAHVADVQTSVVGILHVSYYSFCVAFEQLIGHAQKTRILVVFF